MTWPGCGAGRARPELLPWWSSGPRFCAAAEGAANTEIAERLDVSRPTVIAWRKRYLREGLAHGLADRPRRGRPQTVRRDRRAEILATTLAPPPEALGVTHWSSRLLAAELGVSHSTVARVWAEHDLKPWQTETFKFSLELGGGMSPIGSRSRRWLNQSTHSGVAYSTSSGPSPGARRGSVRSCTGRDRLGQALS